MQMGNYPGVYSQSGLFVCFEGGDGAGKSTQSALLGEWLTSLGHTVVLTRQPGGTRAGQRMREILLDPATGDLSARAEMLLYAADKAEHVDHVVLPALQRGEVVITDRFVDSTLAYQGAGRELPLTDMEFIARWATHDLRPHLTVLLDQEPGRGLDRFAEKDRIEGESAEFHARVREHFLALAKADPGHYVVLDATASIDSLHQQIRTPVEGLL